MERASKHIAAAVLLSFTLAIGSCETEQPAGKSGGQIMRKSLVTCCLVWLVCLITAMPVFAQNLEYVNSMYWTEINDLKVRSDVG